MFNLFIFWVAFIFSLNSFNAWMLSIKYGIIKSLASVTEPNVN